MRPRLIYSGETRAKNKQRVNSLRSAKRKRGRGVIFSTKNTANKYPREMAKKTGQPKDYPELFTAFICIAGLSPDKHWDLALSTYHKVILWRDEVEP